MARKAQQKKMAREEEAGQKAEPNPHAFKTTHTVRTNFDLDADSVLDSIHKKSVAGTIMEQDGEESEVSGAVNIETHEQA